MLFGAVAIGPIEIAILTMAVIVWPMWRICSRAGFPGPLGLLALIPGVNFLLLFFLAFAEWPALRGQRAKAEIDA